MNKVLGRNVCTAALAGAALWLGTAAPVQAAVLVYEPFNYPVTDDTNNHGLTGVNGNPYTAAGGYVAPNGRTWQPTGYGTANTNNLLSPNYDKSHDAVIVSPGLTVPGLSPSGMGNAVSYGGPGYTPRLDIRPTADTAGDITPAQGGVAYYSMAFQITDITGLQTVGGTIAAFNNSVGQQAPNPTVLGGRTLIRPDPAGSGGYQIGLIKAQDGTGIFDPTVHSLSEQQFVVVKYDLNGSAGDDVATMWINPDASTFGGADPAAGTIISNPNGNDIGANVIRSIILRQGNIATNANPAGVIADELRVGTTYADVTPIPEPATAAALGIAALALLGRRRRRD